MLQGSTNILDQLLGGFEVKASGGIGATGVSAEGQAEGLLFGDLLASAANGLGLGDSGEQLVSKLLFPSSDQSAVQDATPAGPTAETLSLIETALTSGQPIAENDQALPDSQPAAHSAKPQTVVAQLPEVNVESLNLQQVLQATDTRLSNGTYQILDVQMAGDRVELTLAAEGKAEEPITISLPAELLKASAEEFDLSNAKTGGKSFGRIPVSDTTNREADRLGDLLSKLNLRSLRVDSGPENVASRQDAPPVQLTLFAEEDGAQIAIKSKLATQDIRIKPQNRREGRWADTQPGKLAVPVKDDNGAVILKPVQRSQAIIAPRNALAQNQFDLPDRLMAGNKMMSTEQVLPGGSSQVEFASRLSETAAMRDIAPSVKMTLPDSIQKPFAANGQSITIRIEPDHLGPARLNLMMRDNILAARVIVDTPVARMAVENSLEQLTEQLSKAGIEVDRIEVQLSGDSRENFFDRRPAWSFAQKSQQFGGEFELDADKSDPDPVVSIPPREYMTSDRVNVLA
jgi:flagellar hook-length control protein FliK